MINERVACATVGIDQLRGRELFGLSSGQRQLTAIASILAMAPHILVLDEPSANLDRPATLHLAVILRRLKDAGHTILVAEHRLWYLTPIADRIVHVAWSTVTGEWSPDELRRRPPG